MAKIILNLRDYSDEYSGVSVNVADLTGIQTWGTMDDLANAFRGHVEAHSVGTVVTEKATQDTAAASDTRPASTWAQRELGIRFYLRDDVNQEIGFFTIPTADLAIGSIMAGQDELDLTAAPTAAFVTWLEANALSRDGNAVTVERAVVVGRAS